MSQDNIIEVMGREGWHKEFPLQKTIVFIGSDPRVDIPLEVAQGGGVSARHLQVIAAPEVGYRLVNLGDSEVFLGPTGEQGLAPRLSTELTEGTQIKVGDFILIFRGEATSSGSATRPGGNYRQSQHLGLRVSLPQKYLAPHRTLEGVITVSNLGDHPGAQLELELEGVERDYFELEPGPLLSSGAEKEVFFRLYHRGAKPRAGDYRFTISAAAPKAYPAEQVSVVQTVRFLPFYEHKLTLTPVGREPLPETPAETKDSPASPTKPSPPATLPPRPKEKEVKPEAGSVWREPPPPAPLPPRLREKDVEADLVWREPPPPATIPEIVVELPPPATTPPLPREKEVEPEASSVWREPPPPATTPKVPAEPPAIPPAQVTPLPSVAAASEIQPAPPVEQTILAEPTPVPEPAPSVRPAPWVEPDTTPEPFPPAVQVVKPPPSPPAVKSPAPVVEPPPVAPIRPAGSLPAHAPSATEAWWEESSPEGVTPTQKADTPAVEDWWSTPEPTPPVRPASRPVIKLKATAEKPKKGTTEVQPPAAKESWWTSPPEPDLPPESPKEQKPNAKKQD